MEIFPIFQESKASSISICIRLEESGVITDCRIRTINFDPVLEYDFGSANVIGRIIMSSECLKEVFCELDSTSETMQLSMSPDSPHFRISTFGHSGVYHVSFKISIYPQINFIISSTLGIKGRYSNGQWRHWNSSLHFSLVFQVCRQRLLPGVKSWIFIDFCLKVQAFFDETIH